MRALVVVESVFGNTRQIADAVAAGLAPHMDVDVLDVVDAPEVVENVDLLVVKPLAQAAPHKLHRV